jgi:esterase/lipase superfamily enzyme
MSYKIFKGCGSRTLLNTIKQNLNYKMNCLNFTLNREKRTANLFLKYYHNDFQNESYLWIDIFSNFAAQIVIIRLTCPSKFFTVRLPI